jgi:hypothetical protein
MQRSPLSRPASPGLAVQIFGASPERTLALVRAAWPLAVGPELGRRTEVVAIEGNTLRLRVADGSWRQALLKMRGTLIAHLRDLAGPLAPSRLSFCDGPLVLASTREPERKAPPADAQAPPTVALREAAAQIGDDEVRAGFLEVAGRYLARVSPETR